MMNKAPNLYNLVNLKEHFVGNGGTMTEDKQGNWVPARPLGYYSLTRRFRIAWGVFTGKYDALKWPGDQ